jgi:hypothetical protein
MSKELVEFINILLIDGEITEKEKTIIFNKAEALGVPVEECDVILESLLGSTKINKNQKLQKKKPEHQQIAVLNKENDLKNKVKKEDQRQQQSQEKINNFKDKLNNEYIQLDKIKEKAPVIKNQLLKDEYTSLLNKCKNKIEKKLGSKIVEKDINFESFLFEANKNKLTRFFQNASWDISSLQNRRKFYKVFFKNLYWLLAIYLMTDFFLDSPLIGNEVWLGFKWWQVLIAAILCILISQNKESKLNEMTVNFDSEDIANTLESVITNDIYDKMELLNNIDSELKTRRKYFK